MKTRLDQQGDQDDPGPDGSHYFTDSEEFSEGSTQEEWVPPHILRLERKGGIKGKDKGKGRGCLWGIQRPGEGWRRFTPPRRSTTWTQASAVPAAPATPGTIDFGAGDDDFPFLDGEPYAIRLSV